MRSSHKSMISVMHIVISSTALIIQAGITFSISSENKTDALSIQFTTLNNRYFLRYFYLHTV